MIFPIDFVLGRGVTGRPIAGREGCGGCDGTEGRNESSEALPAWDLELLPTAQSDQCCILMGERESHLCRPELLYLEQGEP